MSDSKLEPMANDLADLLKPDREGLGRMPNRSRGRIWEIIERKAPVAPSLEPRNPVVRVSGSAKLARSALRVALIAVPSFAVGVGVGVVGRPPRVVTHTVTIVRPEPPRSEPILVQAAVAPVPASATEPVHRAPASRVVATPVASADPQGHDTDLAAERVLVDTARTALSRGQTANALETLQRSASRFPHGQLIDETESLRIRALVLLGRNDEARARGAAFLQRYPDSFQREAVEAALASIP